MMSRLKNSAGPTSVAASIRICTRGLPAGARSRCLCAFSIITIAASIIAPIAIAMLPRLMMLEPSPTAFMAERHQHTDRQHQDGDERAAHVQQEENADQCHNGALFEERAAQRFD